MRDAGKSLVVAAAAAALAACNNTAAGGNNVAMDINDAAPEDIEQLPPDESVDPTSNELANGVADPADNAGTDAPGNSP